MVTLMLPISSINRVPPWAAWKRPRRFSVGAGESALHVAEELGFEQRFGKGAAIDGDEGRFGASAVFVDGAGNEFFSRAAFSSNQHAAILRRDVFDQVENGAHIGAGADDVVETGEAAKLAAQIAGFLFEGQSYRRIAERRGGVRR